MQESMVRLHRSSKATATAGQSWFYRAFLPLGVIANLGLAFMLLARLTPDGWEGWLLVATGAFCCMVAGWLGCAAWARLYWNQALVRQVTVWRQIIDAIFGWLEEAPVPADSLSGLARTLDEVVSEA